MRRATICLLALLIVGVPALSRADSMNESQNPDQYTQEDSFPLKFASYFVNPVGVVLEWTVTRPLHWLSTTRFVAPVLNSDYENEEPAPVPVAELPLPDYLPSSETYTAATPLHEETLSQPATREVAPSEETQPSLISPPAAESSSQPVLH